jgi:hypothetical protein
MNNTNIEQAIRELTDAIESLAAAMRNGRPPEEFETDNSEAAVLARAEANRVEAVHRAVAAAEAAAPAPAAPAPAAPDGSTKEVTEADLRVAAQKLLQAKRLPDILRINKEFGIRRITECPPDRYAALFDALNAALADASGS